MGQVFIGPVTEVQIKNREDKQRAREAEERALEQDLIIAFLLEQIAAKEVVANDAD